MPTFINPARVVVDEGGGGSGGGEAFAVFGAGVVLSAVAVVAFVTEWWPLLLAGVAVVVAVTALSVRALHRRTVVVWDSQIAPPPWAAQTLSAPQARPAAPYRIPAPRQAQVPGIVLAQPRAIEAPRKEERHG